MPDRFNAQGTAPGLVSRQEPEAEIIHLKCPNDRCKSVRATKVNPQPTNEVQGAPHNRMYQCVECKHVWGVATGGYVSI